MMNCLTHCEVMVGTVGTVFAGIGGSTLGAKMAGFEPIWAVERDKRRSVVYRYNVSDNCLVMPAEDVKVSKLEPPTLLLASPPCQEASTMRGITKHQVPLKRHPDADVGKALVPYLTVMRPEWFVMENVSMYRYEPAFAAIMKCLVNEGYGVCVNIVDCADYGVPMHRRRLFLIANRDRRPIRFPSKWLFRVSWHSVISDLLLEESARTLPRWMSELVAIDESGVMLDSKRNYDKKTGRAYLTIRECYQPAFCLTRSHRERPAYILDTHGVSKRVTAQMWARLMTYRDSFVLPASERQAVSGLGDSVPPDMMQQICDCLEVRG